MVQACVAQRIEHLTTDQKVRGSNPFARTRQKSRSTNPLEQFQVVCCAKNILLVSNRVSHSCSEVHQLSKYLQPGLSNEYKPRLLAGFENVLIIVYQRHSNSNALILDKSSQDLFLRGFSFGNKISLLRGRGLLSAVYVTFKSKQIVKSKAHSLHQRRWDAPYPCDRYRAIHKAIIQRSANWRVEIISGK